MSFFLKMMDDTFSDWKFWAFAVVVMTGSILFELFDKNYPQGGSWPIPDDWLFPIAIIMWFLCLAEAWFCYPRKRKVENGS